MKKLFVDGLVQVKDHGLSMEQCRAATIEVALSRKFDEAVAEMAELMQLNVGNTNPAASIAFGEGVETAHAGTGKVTEFVVTAIEFGTGKQSTAGGDDVAVRVAPKDEGGGGGGGGGAAAIAAPANGGKRKRGSSGGGAACVSKKSKTDAATPRVNGMYEMVEEIQNGKPVYIKVGSTGTMCCWYAPNGKWLASRTKHKDANKFAGSAASIETGLAAPELATQWNVDLGDKWEMQPAVAVAVLSGAEMHAAKVAADAAAAAAVAASGFIITGATGDYARRVNGAFSKTGAMQNDKPVYIKDGDADWWCYCGPDGYWYVTDTASKDARKKAGSAASIEIGLAAPHLAKEWQVSVNGTFVLQPAVKLTNT
eukprot:gene25333-biopygen18417